MTLEMTPLRSIELQLHHMMSLRPVLVNDLRERYRWLWLQRVLAAVCVALGIRAAMAVVDVQLDQWLWWLNLAGAALNLGLIPWNLWHTERRWRRQLQEVAMLPSAIDAMKRARSIALQCPKLGPGDDCTYCKPRGIECPFATAQELLARIHPH